MARDRIVELRRVPASQLAPSPANWRLHPDSQRAALAEVLEAVGGVDAVIARQTADGLELIDGHLRADMAGDEVVPVLVVDLDESEAAHVLATLDPLAAMADVDGDALGELLAGLETEPAIDYGRLYQVLDVPLGRRGTSSADLDEIPEPPELAAARGDVWQLGPHRVMCGLSTSTADVARLLAGTVPECIMTDPPYSSGGFQEAGRSSGSVGTAAVHKPVDNDRLSTRGYMALIRSMLECAGAAGFVYVFTDWRQWVNLFDVVESSGYGVRQMIVWDKMTPGMGRGWRSQHELVMCATRAHGEWQAKTGAAQGNVIQCARTGNRHHTTEKPLELLEQLVANTPAAAVYDPFAGSGTTLLAAHNHDRVAYAMEMDPVYVDTIIARWEQLTGDTAHLAERTTADDVDQVDEAEPQP